MQLHLSPEREEQLRIYAQRHGQDPETALDEVLADALAWEQADYEETVESLRRGMEDVKAGRTRPVAEVFEDLRRKYGFPS